MLTTLGRGLFPRDCVLCGDANTEQAICAPCAETLPLLGETCPVCALPSREARICGRCLTRPPHFNHTLAAWAYHYPIDRLVQSFKFHHRLDLAPWLGAALANKILFSGLQLGDYVMVAMPMHRSRLIERGFNQALEIARCVGPIAKGALYSVEKHRQTRHQSELPLSERGANVRGAFRCLRSFAGTTVVVVDDVMTTGASLNELARVLKLAGAAEVVNLVVARTLPFKEYLISR